MGEPPQPPPRSDPEALCTRVVARVIEELSCIEIAPDSPEWTDLLHQGGHRAGQLAEYRGRSGVERMVCVSLRMQERGLSFHKVAVFTEAQSLVPHLLIDAWAEHSHQAHVRVDLLPRLEPTRAAEYTRCCYAPLESAKRAAVHHAHLSPLPECFGLRAPCTPWHLGCTTEAEHVDAAAACVQRYVDHWTRLMRRGIPLSVERESRGVDLAGLSDSLRRHTFSRAVDPVWRELDRALGCETVDHLLGVLRGKA